MSIFKQKMLYGLTCSPCKPKRTRTQSRRADWEDSEEEEPQTLKGCFPVAVTPALLASLPPYLHEIARHVAKSLDKAVILPVGIHADDARAIMSVVYHLRWHQRAKIRVEGDHETIPDIATGLTSLGQFYSEVLLSDKGLRTLAHGIHAVDKNDPSKGYRVQGWDGNIGTIGRHVHIGYRKTLEEAMDLRAAWFLKNRGLDARKYICYKPGTAIDELLSCVRDAAVNAGSSSET